MANNEFIPIANTILKVGFDLFSHGDMKTSVLILIILSISDIFLGV